MNKVLEDLKSVLRSTRQAHFTYSAIAAAIAELEAAVAELRGASASKIAALQRSVDAYRDEEREALQLLATAPVACEVVECRYVPTAVKLLIDFAWRAVNPKEMDE